MATERSPTEPTNDVTIDMNMLSSDLNTEQLPPSPGGSSPNESNNNNENREYFKFLLGYENVCIIPICKLMIQHSNTRYVH